MMSTQSDFNTAFSKIDQISVIDFLLSAASALLAKGRISQKEVDQLKVVVSGLQAVHQGTQGSFLLALVKQGVSFVEILENRWGTRGLVTTIFRANAANSVDASIQSLIALIQDLIKKSELFFNQRFATYEGDLLNSSAMAPEFFLGFSERLSNLARDLSEARSELRTLSAGPVAGFHPEDLIAEKDFAEAMAFNFQIKNPTIAVLEFNALQSKITLAVRGIIEAFSVWFDFVRDNFKKSEVNADLAAKCQWCLAELDKFQRLATFKTQGNLTVFENQRYEANLSFYAINQTVKDLAEKATQAINLTNFKRSDEVSFSRNTPLKAAVIQQLCAKGATFGDAKKSIDMLSDYCFKNDTNPAKLIDSELAKISPTLTTGFRETLETLTTSAQTGLISQDDLVKKARSLSDSAAKFTKVLVILAVAVFTSFCGLKTPVGSDIDILRAPVPFRDAPAVEKQDQQKPK